MPDAPVHEWPRPWLRNFESLDGAAQSGRVSSKGNSLRDTSRPAHHTEGDAAFRHSSGRYLTVVRADDLIPDNSGAQPVPSGQTITTNAIPGATFTNMTVTIPTLSNPTVGPDGAIQSALNPADGKTLVVMTSGYNTYDTATGAAAPASYNGVAGPEYIFVFDTTNPTAPVRNMNPMGQSGASPAAALTPQDTFQGLLWSPDGTKLYVSGGTDGDVLVYNFNLTNKTFSGPTKI